MASDSPIASLAWLRIQSIPRESAKRSSGSSGVTNASRSAQAQLALGRVGLVLERVDRRRGLRVAAAGAQAANASIPRTVTSSWRRSSPSTSGTSGRNQWRRLMTPTASRAARARRSPRSPAS